jgi:hypothetical protein
MLLVGEVRYRLMRRLYGVSRRDSRLMAPISVCVVADLLTHRGRRRVRHRARTPTMGEALLGAAAVKEAAHRLVGPASREATDFGTLISIVIVAAIFRTLLGPPVRSATTQFERTRSGGARFVEGLIGSSSSRRARAA